jgi:Tfp pilus assembly protein PilN
MINLLPPDLKNSYRYGLRNVWLVHWAIALSLGVVGIFVISTAGLIYMQQTAHSYSGQISQAQSSLQRQNLHATQTQVKEITSSLKLAVQVLSKEVLFSKLLARLATLTPSNVILTDLSITQAQTAVTIAARTTDYTAATQMQVNLADPGNTIFSRADIVNITCTSRAGAAPGSIEANYPCTVTIQALFAANNPFLLINDKGR